METPVGVKKAVLGVIAAAASVDHAAIEWIRADAPEEVEESVQVLHDSLSELASQISDMRPATAPAPTRAGKRKR